MLLRPVKFASEYLLLSFFSAPDKLNTLSTVFVLAQDYAGLSPSESV